VVFNAANFAFIGFLVWRLASTARLAVRSRFEYR
jgi:hypothetical protein